jgi:hypothetical protein
MIFKATPETPLSINYCLQGGSRQAGRQAGVWYRYQHTRSERERGGSRGGGWRQGGERFNYIFLVAICSHSLQLVSPVQELLSEPMQLLLITSRSKTTRGELEGDSHCNRTYTYMRIAWGMVINREDLPTSMYNM